MDAFDLLVDVTKGYRRMLGVQPDPDPLTFVLNRLLTLQEYQRQWPDLQGVDTYAEAQTIVALLTSARDVPAPRVINAIQATQDRLDAFLALSADGLDFPMSPAQWADHILTAVKALTRAR